MLRILLLAAIGLALMVGAGIAATRLFQRDPVPGPRDAVEAWMGAIKAGDTPTRQGLTCVARSEEIDEDEIGDEQASSATWSITAEEATGDSASVTADVTYTVEGFLQHDTWTFDVIREAGAWKFCGVRLALTDPDTPRTALVDWMSAVVANDAPTVRSLTCSARIGGITAEEIATAQAQGLTYEITEVSKVDDSTAQVAFTVQVQRNGGPVSFDERWRFVYEPAEPPTAGHAWKACGPAVT